MMERIAPLLGLSIMMAIAWAMSPHKRRFPLRIVVFGLAMQVGLAIVVLQVPAGKACFEYIGAAFAHLLDCVDQGAGFVFGENKVQTERGLTPAYQVSVVAFKVLPTIIFFSSLMSVLYYLGVMQWIVGLIARSMQKTLGTSGAETLSAAGNIFVGQTEAPLLVRPYLNTMTDSELMAVMVGGFATIAGGVMAAYIGMGVPAVHLLTASIMSAPAGLVIAKIMQPEVEKPLTLGRVEQTPPMEAANVVDAAAAGAADGLKLALNVGAMLIAFLSLLFLLDSLVGKATSLLGDDYRITFSQIMGYLSAPFAWLMGIESKDCLVAGKILGTRIVGNEFIAYLQMNPEMNSEFADVSERTRTILTYALCGFANFGSVGIQIGGLGPLAPDRRSALVKLSVRAMIGGLLACYMTACLAALLVP
jgi:CNT family concentrative nucleoside transporter